ncbi:hypothetical protein AVEN_185869-1, partial [Araneus ventricosus]
MSRECPLLANVDKDPCENSAESPVAQIRCHRSGGRPFEESNAIAETFKIIKLDRLT